MRHYIPENLVSRYDSSSLKKQAGAGLIRFIFCFALLGFTSVIATKLAPVYIDYFRIKTSLHELRQDGDILHRETEEILDFLQKNWERNQVTTVTLDQVHIDRQDNHVKIEVQYDVIKPILGNVEALLHFNDNIELTDR